MRLLVVEDEPGLRKALGINLRARGYDVTLAGDGRTALTAASQHPPDAVVQHREGILVTTRDEGHEGFVGQVRVVSAHRP